MLQGSQRLVFYLYLFCEELGYPLGEGVVLPGVMQCRVMKVWDELELLGETGII